MSTEIRTQVVIVAALFLACGCNPEVQLQPGQEPESGSLLNVTSENMPPEEYRGDYTTLSSVLTLPETRIREICGSEHALACAGREGSFDVLYLPNPCGYPSDPYAVLLCHEMAHLQGWSHNPNADAARCQGVMILDNSCRAFAQAKLANESPSERAEREKRWAYKDARQ